MQRRFLQTFGANLRMFAEGMQVFMLADPFLFWDRVSRICSVVRNVLKPLDFSSFRPSVHHLESPCTCGGSGGSFWGRSRWRRRPAGQNNITAPKSLNKRDLLGQRGHLKGFLDGKHDRAGALLPCLAHVLPHFKADVTASGFRVVHLRGNKTNSDLSSVALWADSPEVLNLLPLFPGCVGRWAAATRPAACRSMPAGRRTAARCWRSASETRPAGAAVWRRSCRASEPKAQTCSSLCP